MTLKELAKLLQSGGAVRIEVHSVDPSLYLLFQRFGERLTPIRALSGSTAQYRSRYAALKALADLGVEEIDFVHRSAYGEMIGTETAHNQTELRQRIRIDQLA